MDYDTVTSPPVTVSLTKTEEGERLGKEKKSEKGL